MSAPEDEGRWSEAAVDRVYLQVGDHRPHDRLGRLVPRNPFDGMTLLGMFPTRPPDGLLSFAQLWDTVVPSEHIIRTCDDLGCSKRLVWCACGFVTPLASQGPTACVNVLWRDDELDYDGVCTRFFLPVGRGVRVKRFEKP